MITSKIETITPDIAKEYLKYNSRNRKVKPYVVQSYARDMARGAFITTHQGIAFNENGELTDGQHRLLGIIMSNTPVEMMVTRGLANNAVEAIDRGAARTVRDVFTIESKDDNNIVNMATISNHKIISGINALVAHYKHKMRVNAEDVKRVYSEFKDAVDSVYENIVSGPGAHARASMISAAIVSVANGADVHDVAKFFQVFFKDDINGCDGFNVNCALNWRRQVESVKSSRAYMKADDVDYGTQSAIYNFVNNTSIQRIFIPKKNKYDVGTRLDKALAVDFDVA